MVFRIKLYGPKRRRRVDEEADWLPPKNRPFVHRQPTGETEQKSEYFCRRDADQRAGPRDKPSAKEHNRQGRSGPSLRFG